MEFSTRMPYRSYLNQNIKQNNNNNYMIAKLIFYSSIFLTFCLQNFSTASKKFEKNKVVEVQRSDLLGQYLGSTTEKTKAKIMEARGSVLFVDKAYRLIPSAGKDFG